MKSPAIKMTTRTIKSFFGRYLALMIIVLLSVGFFAGLKVTTGIMHNTAEKYYYEQAFYDYRLISTLGFDEEDFTDFKNLDYINEVEGNKSLDALITINDNTSAYKVMALPEIINIPSLVHGTDKINYNECLVDAERFNKNDIGKTIKIDNDNINSKEYKIVGLVDSPLYLNLDRGTTTIGSGTLSGFIYLNPDELNINYYTDIYLTVNEQQQIYSSSYDDYIEEYKNEIEKLGNIYANNRYDKILRDNNISSEIAEMMGISKPTLYTLTRNENVGYASFESDSAILSGVANIFPVFFILIAMLVCMTTMTRMVDEERMQIGILKALGFSNFKILLKYLLYAGSAAIIGWVIGYFLGTLGMPQLFWFAYKALYGFTNLRYEFSILYSLLTLGVSLICLLGSTIYCVLKELRSTPASAIRPRPPKSGKKVFVERIKPLWNKFSFLQKVSFRNMLRYKMRLFMMLLGVGCTTGLIVTAFGLRDSMVNIASMQYEDLQKYELEATFKNNIENMDELLSKYDEITSYSYIYKSSVEIFKDNDSKSVSLISFESDNIEDVWNIANNGNKISLPNKNEAYVCNNTASKLNLKIGDVIKIRTKDYIEFEIKIANIFDNLVSNYLIINNETIKENITDYSLNTVLINTNTNDLDSISKNLIDDDSITSLIQLTTSKNNVDNALSCMNYIIWVVVFFAGALSFIVIYNLTNINLAERIREVATVQVLGFYPKEVYGYVLRENVMMSIIASFIGLPLGKLFHYLVMSMIHLDLIEFPVLITPLSYVISLICSIIFSLLINQYMKHHINKIKMAESLKTVE